MNRYNDNGYNQSGNGLDVLAGVTFLVAIFNTVLGLSNLDKNKESIKAQRELKNNQKKIEYNQKRIEDKVDKLVKDSL
jgi:peroxiredoxin family protein